MDVYQKRTQKEANDDVELKACIFLYNVYMILSVSIFVSLFVGH